MILTQELVKEIFEYKGGCLYWKTKISRGVKILSNAGYLAKNRCVIGMFSKHYFRYKLIFLYHHGYIPDLIDHIDRNSSNDRIENLRVATRSQNMRNCTAKAHGTSKYLGVHVNLKRTTKKIYGVKITAKTGEPGLYLGYFEKEHEAALAYNKAAVKYHGEFANLNIIQP